MNNREHFIEKLKSTKREGIENTIAELEGLGFFSAPASSRFHLNCEGGLVEHSMNVCNVALDVREVMIARDPSLADRLPINSIIIAALLHDICKADIYKPAIKKQKNKLGIWVPVQGYDVEYSNFPLGHGEKSVIQLLRWGLEMTDDEIMAIRWHMSGFDLAFQSPESRANYGAATDKCPLLAVLRAADGLASHIMKA